MKKRSFSFFLIFLFLVGLVWYFGKDSITGTSSNEIAGSNLNKIDTSSRQDTTQKLISLNYNNGAREIISTDFKGEQKKILFSDRDEDYKIKMTGGLYNGEILAVMVKDKIPEAQLATVKIDGSGKKEVLVQSFPLPKNISLSPNNQSFAYTTFSNVEENYGYTLYVSTKKGDTRRELLRSDQEIKFPVWNNNVTKIAFVKVSAGKMAIEVFDLNANQSEEIYSTKLVINSLNLQNNKLVFSEKGSRSEVFSIDWQGKSKIKLFDTSSNAYQPFLSNDELNIAFVPLEPGSAGNKIYTYNLKNTNQPKIFDGLEVLGWR